MLFWIGEETKMKKLMNLSLVYLIAALAFGVFYREFTKLNNFAGETMLRAVHTHLFMLGVVLLLLLALFVRDRSQVVQSRKMRRFLILYNLSLPLFILTLLARGIVQVLQVPLSSAANASLSGIAGISHILLTIALGLFFSLLYDSQKALQTTDAKIENK